MIQHNTTPIRAAVVVAVVFTLGAAALTGAVTAQTDEPTITVSDATVQSGGSATVDVVLTSAPDGLAGYAAEFSVEGDGVTIEGASYPDAFGLSSSPTVADDGRSVTLEAADVNGQIEPGDTDVVLATVELNGEAAGETTLTVEPLQFDADGGASVNPVTQSGTLTVPGDEAAAASADSGSDVDESANADTGESSEVADATADTTSTSFGFPAGGIVLTALALALVVGFAASRRR